MKINKHEYHEFPGTSGVTCLSVCLALTPAKLVVRKNNHPDLSLMFFPEKDYYKFK